MRLLIGAIGRAAKAPERDLVERYMERTRALGRSLGIRGIDVFELPEARAGDPDTRRRGEAERLLSRTGEARIVALDATGRGLASEAFAERLDGWRLAGQDVAFLVGGPDGHGEAVLSRSALVWSLGAHTMPHLLVRAVLAEQLYRAVTILAHHPYHRA